MATVNVYTYYTHKLAYEKVQRETPRPAARGLELPVTKILLAVLALLWLVLLPPSHPVLAVAGALLGLTAAIAVQRFRQRSSKFMRALNGMPLGADDLRVLCGH